MDQVAARVQSAETDPPTYMRKVLGPLPHPNQPRRRRAWRSGAITVERYRVRWQVDDEQEPLGPARLEADQFPDQEVAARLLRDAQQPLPACSSPYWT